MYVPMPDERPAPRRVYDNPVVRERSLLSRMLRRPPAPARTCPCGPERARRVRPALD